MDLRLVFLAFATVLPAILLVFCGVVVLGWGIIVGITSLVVRYGGDWEALGVGLISSGIWLLISLVGMAVLLVALALPGNKGPNRYGRDPLRPEPEDGGALKPTHAYASPDASSPMESANATSEVAERRFCTQCGGQLQAEARFCTLCGAAV